MLPNEILIALSEKMPEDSKEISACFKAGVSSLVRMNILELSRLIRDTKNDATMPINMFSSKSTENNTKTEDMDDDELIGINSIKYTIEVFFCFVFPLQNSRMRICYLFR